MSIEIILQSSYNFKVKKIFLKILFFLFFSSHSFACPLLQVPIGSPVSSAVETFEFLDTYNEDVYGADDIPRYQKFAIDYCEGSSLENADLEVTVYQSRISSISLISTDPNFKNEIYQFTKNYIQDPGEEVKKDDWLGYKNLSVGNLIIFYSKIKIMKEIVEVLEITNTEMVDYMSGEEVIDVLG